MQLKIQLKDETVATVDVDNWDLNDRGDLLAYKDGHTVLAVGVGFWVSAVRVAEPQVAE